MFGLLRFLYRVLSADTIRRSRPVAFVAVTAFGTVDADDPNADRRGCTPVKVTHLVAQIALNPADLPRTYLKIEIGVELS